MVLIALAWRLASGDLTSGNADIVSSVCSKRASWLLNSAVHQD
jgi:hypothetical protein